MAMPAERNPPKNRMRKSLFVASSANAILKRPPQIAARAIHIMMSCENFISVLLESSITLPGFRTIIGCSAGVELVKIAPEAFESIDWARIPLGEGPFLRGAFRRGAGISIVVTSVA